MDYKKTANNMLEFMFDPTVIPVEKRLYFRPEEKLQNEAYEAAKADSYAAYGDQRHNSCFYPIRNKSQKEVSIMDRKTLVASLDILSQNFLDGDPIGKDLRTMAYAISKMSDEELESRLAKKVKFVECPVCKEKVVKKKNISEMKEAAVEDFWTIQASRAVQNALVEDVKGSPKPEKKPEESPKSEKKPGESPKPEKKPGESPKPEKKPGESPKPEKKPGESPKPEKKQESPKPEKKAKESPKPEKKPEDKQEKEEKACKIVDTSILTASIEGVQFEGTTVDDAILTADDKARLDLLFKK